MQLILFREHGTLLLANYQFLFIKISISNGIGYFIAFEREISLAALGHKWSEGSAGNVSASTLQSEKLIIISSIVHWT